MLNEICRNRQELFSLRTGAQFYCDYDVAGHLAMQQGLLRWEQVRPCTGWECAPYHGV